MQPPHPLTLTLTLPPGKVVPPILFHQNDRKGCKRDYLIPPSISFGYEVSDSFHFGNVGMSLFSIDIKKENKYQFQITSQIRFNEVIVTKKNEFYGY